MEGHPGPTRTYTSDPGLSGPDAHGDSCRGWRQPCPRLEWDKQTEGENSSMKYLIVKSSNSSSDKYSRSTGTEIRCEEGKRNLCSHRSPWPGSEPQGHFPSWTSREINININTFTTMDYGDYYTIILLKQNMEKSWLLTSQLWVAGSYISHNAPPQHRSSVYSCGVGKISS